MRHVHAAALLAAALLAGCGRPLLSAQLEIPEVQLVLPAQSFPIANAGPENLCDLVPAACLKTDLSYDLGAEVPLFDEPGFTVDLRLTRIALTLTADPDPLSTISGPADLSGVESVRVLVQAPGTSTWTTIASYAKPVGATPASVTVSENGNLDLAPFLSGGKLGFRVELRYDLATPPPSFFADVEAAFSIVATVSYREAFL